MKIISGGQTGADRAGLEAGRFLKIPTGGFVPKGWLTEKGPDLSLKEFGCVEHTSSKYPPRTKANVKAADGTVWFGKTNSQGFTCTQNAVTHRFVKTDKIYPFIINPTIELLKVWLIEHNIHTLNVAGNRESRNSGIFKSTYETLIKAIEPQKDLITISIEKTNSIVDEFLITWSQKVKEGSVSALNGIEVSLLRIYTQWLEDTNKMKDWDY